MNSACRIVAGLTVVAAFFGVPRCGYAKDEKPEPHPAVSRDWTQFGRSESRKLDRAVYDEATRVRYVADRVALELHRLSVKPNGDAAGREYARKTFGNDHTSIGTCGHVSRSLKKALLGAGVNVRLVKLIVGRKSTRRTRQADVDDRYNVDHAAVLYFSSSGPIVYDLWWAGREKGTYRLFPRSDSRGIPFSKWLTNMRGRNYVAFHVAENPKLGNPIEDPLQRIGAFAAAARKSVGK